MSWLPALASGAFGVISGIVNHKEQQAAYNRQRESLDRMWAAYSPEKIRTINKLERNELISASKNQAQQSEQMIEKSLARQGLSGSAVETQAKKTMMSSSGSNLLNALNKHQQISAQREMQYAEKRAQIEGDRALVPESPNSWSSVFGAIGQGMNMYSMLLGFQGKKPDIPQGGSTGNSNA